jgi:hypothetical protein
LIFVPRQRHWKVSPISISAKVLVPLTRHEFRSMSRIEGCSQKALAPLAIFLSRYGDRSMSLIGETQRSRITAAIIAIVPRGREGDARSGADHTRKA